jgi:hypothetical protein
MLCDGHRKHAMTTTPRPHPPALVSHGICAACHRFVLTKAGLLTTCAVYTIRSGYPEQRPAKKRG